jgi:hypothetical protein
MQLPCPQHPQAHVWPLLVMPYRHREWVSISSSVREYKPMCCCVASTCPLASTARANVPAVTKLSAVPSSSYHVLELMHGVLLQSGGCNQQHCMGYALQPLLPATSTTATSCLLAGCCMGMYPDCCCSRNQAHHQESAMQQVHGRSSWPCSEAH